MYGPERLNKSLTIHSAFFFHLGICNFFKKYTYFIHLRTKLSCFLLLLPKCLVNVTFKFLLTIRGIDKYQTQYGCQQKFNHLGCDSPCFSSDSLKPVVFSDWEQQRSETWEVGVTFCLRAISQNYLLIGKFFHRPPLHVVFEGVPPVSSDDFLHLDPNFG